MSIALASYCYVICHIKQSLLISNRLWVHSQLPGGKGLGTYAHLSVKDYRYSALIQLRSNIMRNLCLLNASWTYYVARIYSTSTLSWSLIRNSCSEGMLSTMYGILCLTTYFLECPRLQSFKYSKSIFKCSWLKRVPWWLLVKWTSYSCFFTDELNVDVL